MKLETARVLITGGGSGIGLAAAKLLGARGARVVIAGRDEGRLKAAAKESGATPIRCDVTREEDVQRTVAETLARLGELNVLINNAGIGTFEKLVETSAEDFRRVWETNVLGAMLVARECAKHFVARPAKAGGPGGSIVNIASTAAQRGFVGGSTYVASKFALAGLNECWRAELRTSNVRVMQINPSEIQNDFGADHGRAARRELNPTKLVSDDVAHLIVALLELEDRGFVTEASLWATNPR
jgi:3-oxoacyl-[acyl-carrier protein] reductase